MKKIIIIGGGASGLMLASLLPRKSVIMIEGNSKLGTKLLISGGGKCNITNAKMGEGYYLGEKEFVDSVLKVFNEKKLLHWLERFGLRPVVKKETQYFCQKSAKELLSIFIKESQKQTIILNEKVLGVEKRDNFFYVKSAKKSYQADIVVVASGGLSFTNLGATKVGYEIATHFSHTLKTLAPALVGFTVQKEQFFFKELSGASTDVKMRIGSKMCEGSLLFTHKGISGPVVLNSSLYWQKGQISIDFLRGFSFKNIAHAKKQISSLLPLPKKITKAFLVHFNVEDKSFYRLSTLELEKLKILNDYRFSPAGTFGYSKAEVTKGGVSTYEIDEATMMSKKEKNLYFIGEVVDVTGELGGYNFQWAFSSAFVCAKALKKELW